MTPLRLGGSAGDILLSAEGHVVGVIYDVEEARQVVRMLNSHAALVAVLRDVIDEPADYARARAAAVLAEVSGNVVRDAALRADPDRE